MTTIKKYNLVADIGGTNARFAMVEKGSTEIVAARSLACNDYATIFDAIKHYLKDTSLGDPQHAALSIALPVTGDFLTMTNHSWQFSVKDTCQSLGLSSLKVLNDYTALALALPFIPAAQRRQIGGGDVCDGYPKAAIGPGTGLGVSGVIPAEGYWIPLESEGGHVSYGGLNQRETDIIQIVRKQMDHVSVEALVSGSGLSLIYAALTTLRNGEAKQLKPNEITDLAINKQCDTAVEALSVFCEIFGTAAGNLALTLGARGGVYIGGGIVPRIAEFFEASNFRERFEQHGRFSSYLRKIPTFMVDMQYPALIGAMVSLGKEYKPVGVTFSQ